MKLGLDTNVLIYAHLAATEQHAAVTSFLTARLADESAVLVVTPIVLHELVHVITDERRFQPAVPMAEALAIARGYLGRSNVECAPLDEAVVAAAFALMQHHGLGRRRIADTLNAAAFLAAGVAAVATCNARDFELFDELRVVNPCAGDVRDS